MIGVKMKCWKKIQSGMNYPFVDVYEKMGCSGKYLKVGVTKVEGKIGENPTWSVRYDDHNAQKRLFNKDFKGENPMNRAKKFAQKYMKNHDRC